MCHKVKTKNHQRAIIVLNLDAVKIPSFTTIFNLRLFIPGGLSKICHPVEEELRSQNFYIVYSEKNKKRP
jgi:hypothetical protein